MSAESTLEASEPAGYPRAWAFDGLLNGGEAVFVRPILPSDATLLIGLGVASLTPSTRRGADDAARTRALVKFSTVDYATRMAFVALANDEIIAVASYERLAASDPRARVAFAVVDSYQHQGVATLLFESLASFARARGIERFVADVATDNRAMLAVIDGLGLATARSHHDDVVAFDVDLRPTSNYRAIRDEREASAEVASMKAILTPATIAVVGAGRRAGSAGHEVVRSLLAGDVAATVYPVNPSARSICGVPAYPNLSSIPERVDLAIVAVPPEGVPKVIEEAASCDVRAVTLITAGFAETGRAGAKVEAELLALAREHGMRIVGPNCLGLVNTDPDVRMNATFTGLDPRPGHLALISQSGAVGIVLAEQASAAGLGISTFVSMGNKLDVSSNDLLCYLEDDEQTSVIALYLESLGNPRKFARIARRIGARKPIVALKAGRSAAGARAALSHTAAAATPEVAVEALLRGAGVIKVDRLEELLDVSAIALAAPLPKGRRVALVGNSGGPLILATDACEASGMSVSELDDKTKEALREHLVPAAATANPVDMTADGTPEVFEQTLEIVMNDESVDAVIVVVTEVVALSAKDARAVVDRVASSAVKPLVACVMGGGAFGARSARAAEISSPERAASALAHLCRYAEWRARPRGADVPAGSAGQPSVVRDVVAARFARDAAGGWLELDEAAKLLGACAVPMLATDAANSPEEAASRAASIGFPVALKARSGELVHKSDVGAVAIGLGSAEAVARTYREMQERLGSSMGGAVVQPMATPGVEAIVGLTVDPVFGPLVMVGLGGVMTDLVGDRAFAVPPLDPGDADAMIDSLRTAPLLDGYRGAVRVDHQALVAVIEAVARAAEEVPELVELDLNPVVVTAQGALVVDCKARLAPRNVGPGPLFRALRPRRRP